MPPLLMETAGKEGVSVVLSVMASPESHASFMGGQSGGH